MNTRTICGATLRMGAIGPGGDEWDEKCDLIASHEGEHKSTVKLGVNDHEGQWIQQYTITWGPKTRKETP